MAADDFGGTVRGARIEVIGGDHQNKPDIAANLARSWYEEDGVDAIVEVPVSSATIAVQSVAAKMGKAFLITGGALSDLTGKFCSTTSVHWADDSRALARSNSSAVVASGGRNWFFITSDFVFGRTLETQASEVVTEAGGQVVGSVRHPLGTTDFSSFLVSAHASGAQVIGLANVATETVNSIKQAREFGVTRGGQRLAAFLLFVNDVRSIGLETAQGLYLTASFYWDYDDKTRAFARRFFDRTGAMPNHEQASNYSAVLHYLKAIDAAGTDDAETVVRRMKAMPVDDFFTKGPVTLRKDGRLMNDMELYEVKSPAESHGEWDLYKPLKRISAADVYPPLEKSECPLLPRM
jgi:branched-chain amino acid transport system substrate-binding protein